MVYLSHFNQQIDGLLKLSMRSEEVNTTINHSRIRLYINILYYSLQQLKPVILEAEL